MSGNPFEPPKAPIGEVEPMADPRGYHVEGKMVVVLNGASFPDRCVFCNKDQGDDGRRFFKDLYYVPTYVYFLVLFNVLFLIIGYYLARRPVLIRYSVCGEHRREKKRNVFLCVLYLAILIFYLIVGIAYEMFWFLVLGLISFLVLLVFALRANKVLVARKKKGELFWITGFGDEFLRHLDAEPLVRP